MNGPAPSARTVRCPRCGGTSLYAPENAWRPFCSEGCRRHDLGDWANERFRVADRVQPLSSDDADNAT